MEGVQDWGAHPWHTGAAATRCPRRVSVQHTCMAARSQQGLSNARALWTQDKNGKLTRAELEDAALALGFTLEQSQRMFERWAGRMRKLRSCGAGWQVAFCMQKATQLSTQLAWRCTG